MARQTASLAGSMALPLLPACLNRYFQAMNLRKPLFSVMGLVVLMCVLSVSYGLHYTIVKPREDALKCRSIARSIGAAVRNYASNWNGWTHSDLDHYVKEFGYRVSSDTGYFGEAPPWYDPDAVAPTRSQKHAAGIEAFRCPADDSPEVNKHGIPSSYKNVGIFSGAGIMRHTQWSPAELPVVLESGARHSDGKKPATRGGHCVFADLHVEIRNDQQRLLRISRDEN